MMKPETIDIADSNIAMLGSDLELEVRQKAAETVEAYKGAGKALGIEIWRIEKFKVVKWPKPKYGSFFSGDSFIVMNTYPKNPKEPEGAFAWNIHFWLGESTSQDEMGVAAYMTVVLDDLLGTEPVQYRETQDHESAAFLALWDNCGGMKIMEGGVDSGFNHVTAAEYKPRLLHVKGTRRTMRVKQVELATSAMNHGDVFILDNGLDLVCWQGDNAGVWEKRRAGDVMNSIKDERNHKAKSSILEGTDDHENFWDIVGDRNNIKSADEGGDDEAKDEAPISKLLRVSDASGTMSCKEEASGPLTKSMLDKMDVFIVDIGQQLYVWVGTGATKHERRMGMKYATDYLGDNNRPLHTPIAKVLQNNEPNAFHEAFSG